MRSHARSSASIAAQSYAGSPQLLPAVREVVGRRAERDVGAELIAMRPHVGALAADDERHVAHERDAELLELRACGAATARARSTGGTSARARASRCRRRRARAFASARTFGARSRSSAGHVVQPWLVVRAAERDVERVIAEPRAFAIDEREERLARARPLPSASSRSRKRANASAKRALLQLAHGGVVDGRRAAQALELGEPFRHRGACAMPRRRAREWRRP